MDFYDCIFGTTMVFVLERESHAETEGIVDDAR